MRLFSEATLLKIETACTRRPKRWKDRPPTFWEAWLNPMLILKPHQKYKRKEYLRVASVSALFATVLISFALCLAVAISLWLFPNFLTLIHNPKYHALIIGSLSKEGVYQTPWAVPIYLGASFTINWPQYFFWNRCAKRLQQEGVILVPIVAAANFPDDTVWPPASRL